MNDEELTSRVVALITSRQKLPQGKVTPESSFADLGIDSLDGIDLLFAFEEEFDVTIPEHLAQQMKNVPQVVAGLRTLLDRRAGRATPTGGVAGASG